MQKSLAPNLLLENSLMPFDAVLRQSPLGMAVINYDGSFEAVNTAYCSIYGYTQEELIGQIFTILFKPEMRDYVLSRHQQFLDSGGSLGGEWEVVRRDGCTLHIISESAQMTGHDGKNRRLVYVTDITARRNMEYELIQSRQFAHAMLDSLSAHICVLDETGTILSSNKSWQRFYQSYGSDQGQGEQSEKYLHVCLKAMNFQSDSSQNFLRFQSQLFAMLEKKIDYFELEYPCHSDSGQRWFIARVARIDGTNPMRIIAAHDNVTALKLAQEKLRDALGFSRKLINSLQDGFTVIDTRGKALEVNPALCRMTGFTEAELLADGAFLPYWPKESVERIVYALQQVLNGKDGEFELVLMRKNGDYFPSNITVSSINDDSGKVINYIAVIKDVTERKRMEEDVHRLAFYDPLTSLPNRRLLHDRIEQTLASSKRSGNHSALLMIDLDNFKPLNDHFGHDAGDLLLIEVANRLKCCVREVDTVARLGGDEFVIIINELHPDALQSRELVGMIAEKIRSSLNAPYHLPIHYGGDLVQIEHDCSASIGVAIFSAQYVQGNEIMKWADQAMYKAKEDGRNLVRFFHMQDDD
jgi:diguanylate cyclase (GGDEF)-like protein/PAS domain S-box-containing protein